MTPSEYTDLALRSAGDHAHDDQRIYYSALSLCEEAGEIAGLTKKLLFHGHPYNRDKFIEELGDLCWYLNIVLKVHKTTWEEVWEKNIDKLERRYPEGFSSERSINREV